MIKRKLRKNHRFFIDRPTLSEQAHNLLDYVWLDLFQLIYDFPKSNCVAFLRTSDIISMTLYAHWWASKYEKCGKKEFCWSVWVIKPHRFINYLMRHWDMCFAFSHDLLQLRNPSMPIKCDFNILFSLPLAWW